MTTTASSCLASGSLLTSGNHLVLTCPAGQTLIVKDIRIMPFVVGTGATVSVAAWSSSGAQVHLLYATGAQVNVPIGLACWVVLQPNQYMTAAWAGGRTDYWISGSALTPNSPWVPQLPQLFSAGTQPTA